MAKKLGAPIALGVITILAIALITGSNDTDDDLLNSTFSINATYFPNLDNPQDAHVYISFKDKSEKTNAVILEVLGMEESYQKTFLSSEFEENILFPNPPKYGWEIHPVTMLVDHQDLGQVSIKTEIRPSGENPASIIYGRP